MKTMRGCSTGPASSAKPWTRRHLCDEEDRRALQVLARSGSFAEIADWVCQDLPREKPGQDLHAVMRRSAEGRQSQRARDRRLDRREVLDLREQEPAEFGGPVRAGSE